MVCRVINRTPTKPTCFSTRRSRHQKTTPTPPRRQRTPTISAVLATINDSLFICRRRLVKIFSKLKIKKSPKRRRGFQKLPKSTTSNSSITQSLESTLTLPHSLLIRKPLAFGDLLPPLTDPEKIITIVLDLDETLVHSKPDPPPERYHFTVSPVIDGQIVTFYVVKRPGVDEFLEFLARRKSSFEVVVFTAGLRAYASLVLDELDKDRKAIKHRLYRDSCREVEGRWYVKDLSELGRDLRKVVIVDDNPYSYSLQPENGISVRAFVDDAGDRELWRLMEIFDDDGIHGVEDLREAVRLFANNDDGGE